MNTLEMAGSWLEHAEANGRDIAGAEVVVGARHDLLSAPGEDR